MICGLHLWLGQVFRLRFSPGLRSDTLGFRLALVPSVR
jgi:hypothetical protein